VRLHRRRRLRGPGSIHVDGDLAIQVQAGQLVPVGFRNYQPVAHEYHGRFQLGGQLGARAQGGVGAEGERLDGAVADQGEAGLFRNQLARLELHRLQVARDARRLESQALELAGHVFHGLAEFAGANVAALQLVVGQELNVRPPEFALGGVVHRGGRERRHGKKEEDGFFERKHSL